MKTNVSITPLQEIFYEAGLATEQEAEMLQSLAKRFRPSGSLRIAAAVLSLLIRLGAMEPHLKPVLEPAGKAIGAWISQRKKQQDLLEQGPKKPRKAPYTIRPRT